MADSFLSVFTMPKRKKSLSCDNIVALMSNSVTDCNHDRGSSKRKNSAGTYSLHRFLRPKSPLIHSMDGAKSVSSDLVNNVDCRLSQIKKQLATFREQDVKFRERMGSLSDSIDDIASSSSLTASELSTASDLVMSNNHTNEELIYKDDKILENEIRGISKSFSCDVLNRIPTIAVKCYKTMQASDPELHDTAS